MKVLTPQEADSHLRAIGMRIGAWNQISVDDPQFGTGETTTYRAPSGSRELYNFSQHVAGWLPRGNWKIFQIDNSTSLDSVQKAFFGRLLFGSMPIPDLNKNVNRSFLFEFGNDEQVNEFTELLILNLIYVFLLFECHGYVVSSGSSSGELLAVQDGAVSFISNSSKRAATKSLLERFELSPLQSPEWLLGIVSRGQVDF